MDAPGLKETIAAIQIPDQCRGCGILCELTTELVGLHIGKRLIEEEAGSLVGDAGEAFDRMIDESMPAEYADEIKSGVRKFAGEKIENIDKAIEDATQEINSNVLSCNGILKMRATKDDVTYTANICTSQKQYIRDGKPTHMPIHVKADSSKRA